MRRGVIEERQQKTMFIMGAGSLRYGDIIAVIEAAKGADGEWRGGLLASVDREGKGFAQQFGYFEMRARFPAGKGLWPAFWLIGRRQAILDGVPPKTVGHREIG